MKGVRLFYIDMLKCFAIFLVVWQHYVSFYGVPTPLISNLSQTVLSFHMPLFAILSGYFFSYKDSPLVFMSKKARQLLVPFFVWIIISDAIIWGLIKYVNYLNGGDSVHLGGIINAVIGSCLDSRLWFLKALFFCFIYAYVAFRINKKHQLLFLFVSIILLYILSFLGIIPNNWSVTNGFVFLYPFFTLGIFWKNYSEIVAENKIIILIISFIVFMIMRQFWHGFADCFYYMNTSVFADADIYGNEGLIIVSKTIFRFFIGCFGSAFFISLFSIIFKNNSEKGFIKKCCQTVGQYTLPIYILHSYLFEFWKFDVREMDPYVNTFFCLSLSLCIIVLCTSFASLTSKNRLFSKILWGK